MSWVRIHSTSAKVKIERTLDNLCAQINQQCENKDSNLFDSTIDSWTDSLKSFPFFADTDEDAVENKLASASKLPK